MLRCAAFFVIAAYFYVRLISKNLRALPANFLRNHLIFELFKSPSVMMVPQKVVGNPFFCHSGESRNPKASTTYELPGPRLPPG
jgi:hypothetical protein